MLRSRWLLGLAVGLAVALVAVGMGWLPTGFGEVAVADDDDVTELTLIQEAPELTQVDLGESGASHGDLLMFEAALLGEDGQNGTLTGFLLTADLPDDDGEVLEERIGSLVFHLDGENSIVVHGGSVYPDGGVEMKAGNGQIRAVIGGTGKYIGARGQVTTTRNDDQTYEHRFELLD
jgi:hypothetical protein